MIIIILYIPANRVRDTSPKAISLICTILLPIHDNNNYIYIYALKCVSIITLLNGVEEYTTHYLASAGKEIVSTPLVYVSYL